MENIIIEKMTLQDVNQIKDSLIDEFDDFWNYSILKNEIENEKTCYLVVKINEITYKMDKYGLNEQNILNINKNTKDEIIAFAGITIITDFAELNNIVVKKKFRGKGISKILLGRLIDEARRKKCKQLNLEVSKINSVAINLYKSFNFECVGERDKYYNGQGAWLFTKKL